MPARPAVLDVSVAQPIAQVPPHRHCDQLGEETAAAAGSTPPHLWWALARAGGVRPDSASLRRLFDGRLVRHRAQLTDGAAVLVCEGCGLAVPPPHPIRAPHPVRGGLSHTAGWPGARRAHAAAVPCGARGPQEFVLDRRGQCETIPPG